jgi:hypothetical protein
LGRQRSLCTIGSIIFSLRNYEEPQDNRETNRHSNQALPNGRSESYCYTKLFYGTRYFQPTQKFCDKCRCLSTFIYNHVTGKRVIKSNKYTVFSLVITQLTTDNYLSLYDLPTTCFDHYVASFRKLSITKRSNVRFY